MALIRESTCDHEPTCSHPCIECMEDERDAFEAERDHYRQALERIAATEPTVRFGWPWKHWRTQAREALEGPADA